MSDTLFLSLGRDEEIAVKRVKINNLKSDRKFISDTRKEQISYEINVKNNKSSAINVEIFDQIPVSMEKEILVILEEKGGADFTPENGKMVWKLAVPERKGTSIKFDYTLKYPRKR